MISFLIITYGDNFLQDCIKQIRNFYKDTLICIVDNNLNSICNLHDIKNNIRYSKNDGNHFELGSIWYSTKKWKDVSKFIIFHNTFILLQKIPEDILNKDYCPLWTSTVTDYSPEIPFVINKLNQIGITVSPNKVWKSICGCCCIIKTEILNTLIEYKFDKIYATNKHEAVGTEIIFGYLIHEYLNIQTNALHKYPINDYFTGRKHGKWIKKVGSGQGSAIFNGIYNFDLNLLPSDINKYNDINKLLILSLIHI